MLRGVSLAKAFLPPTRALQGESQRAPAHTAAECHGVSGGNAALRQWREQHGLLRDRESAGTARRAQERPDDSGRAGDSGAAICDTPKPTLRELQLRAKLRADLHHEPAAVGDMGGPLRPADDADDVADAGVGAPSLAFGHGTDVDGVTAPATECSARETDAVIARLGGLAGLVSFSETCEPSREASRARPAASHLTESVAEPHGGWGPHAGSVFTGSQRCSLDDANRKDVHSTMPERGWDVLNRAAGNVGGHRHWTSGATRRREMEPRGSSPIPEPACYPWRREISARGDGRSWRHSKKDRDGRTDRVLDEIELAKQRVDSLHQHLQSAETQSRDGDGGTRELESCHESSLYMKSALLLGDRSCMNARLREWRDRRAVVGSPVAGEGAGVWNGRDLAGNAGTGGRAPDVCQVIRQIDTVLARLKQSPFRRSQGQVQPGGVSRPGADAAVPSARGLDVVNDVSPDMATLSAVDEQRGDWQEGARDPASVRWPG